MGCVTWLLIIAGAVVTIVSIIRWFEQVTESVEQRWWNKTILLVVFPPAVWFFSSRVSAGRPTAVPHHEPVRGFGTSPTKPHPRDAHDGPPPGTPKEFIGVPKLPPPKERRVKPAIDPDKLAKLKQKMKEQGMLDDDP
jgi:hypothetical protein